MLNEAQTILIPLGLRDAAMWFCLAAALLVGLCKGEVHPAHSFWLLWFSCIPWCPYGACFVVTGEGEEPIPCGDAETPCAGNGSQQAVPSSLPVLSVNTKSVSL